MHHYIALLWNAKNSGASHQAVRLRKVVESLSTGWKSIITEQGLAVYDGPRADRGMQTYILPDKDGVIIGRLFSTDNGLTTPSLAIPSARKIEETAGACLLRHYWGNYIALLHSPECDKAYVIRDCSGHIPCYYTEQEGVYIFFASLADVSCLGIKFTVNDRYLAQSILQHPLHVRRSAR